MEHDSRSDSDTGSPARPPLAAPRVSGESDRLAGTDEGETHDRGLIIERLGWTPEQRLDANTTFLRFYLSVRPQGPLLRSE